MEDHMLNTAKYTIKKAAKDQVEFVGAILTGVFAGSIFTLAYIKYWDTSKVTFADIGGMLAGSATVGLLIIAWRTADSWKIQRRDSELKELLNSLQSLYFETTTHLNKIAMSLANKERAENQSEIDLWELEVNTLRQKTLDFLPQFESLENILKFSFNANDNLLEGISSNLMQTVAKMRHSSDALEVAPVKGCSDKFLLIDFNSYREEFENIIYQVYCNLEVTMNLKTDHKKREPTLPMILP